MARLVIFDDRVRGLELPDRPVFIGRSKKNDIPIHDGLLSRKHCSIEPVGAGYRLLDLKSSNGTYLNGRAIDKVNLKVDDIIEIGRTVIVFLEEGVWSRGEGLAQLRNPLKAQELIGRIRLHHRSRGPRSKIPLVSVGSGTVGRKAAGAGRRARRAPRPGAAAALQVAALPQSFADLAEALEAFITHRAVFLLSQKSPPLRRLVLDVLEEVLGKDAAPAGPAELRERVRAGVRARLPAALEPGPPEANKGAPAGGEAAGAGER